ncbi:MAG TPA: 30S ribosomal protein S9 [Vitreimonas sp.]|nr:30S ribosomal protein S9 [Vitreimonas sp.]
MARKLAKKNSTKVQKVVKKARPEVQTGVAKNNRAAEVNFIAPTGEYTEGVGRRKTATARVRLYHQAGDFIVNGKAAGQYFATVPNSQTLFNQPFVITNTKNQFTVSVKVSGSGPHAQLEAMIHGISRALNKFDPQLHDALKKAGYLTRDDRMKETRKIGSGGKARRKRQSPKR